MEPTVIVSINVHENLSFLEKQIEKLLQRTVQSHGASATIW